MADATSRFRVAATFLVLLFGAVGCQAPVSVGWTRAITNPNGYVLEVRNKANKPLACRVVTADRKISHEFGLAPTESKRFGLLQIGRSFRSREKGEIEVEGYPDKAFQAP